MGTFVLVSPAKAIDVTDWAGIKTALEGGNDATLTVATGTANSQISLTGAGTLTLDLNTGLISNNLVGTSPVISTTAGELVITGGTISGAGVSGANFITAGGDLTITDTSIGGQNGTNAGAIFASNNAVTITSSAVALTMLNNTTVGTGGFLNGNASDITVVTAGSAITFQSNTAAEGGAFYNNGGTLTLDAVNGNIVFNGNTATTAGGAIYNTASGQVNVLATGANYVDFQTTDDTIHNEGTLTLGDLASGKTGAIVLDGSITDAAITTGTTNINGAVVLMTLNPLAEITQNNLNINSGSLAIDASKLHITNDIVNQGRLLLSGGTAASPIIWNQNVVDNQVTKTGEFLIASGFYIDNFATLTQATITNQGIFESDASKLLVGSINNTGTLTLTGGTLTGAVTGSGMTNINGNVIFGTGASLTNVTVANAGALDIGTSAVDLGSGSATIDGVLKINISDITSGSTVYTGGSLTTTGALTLGADSVLSLTIAPRKLDKNASTGDLQLITAGSYSGNFASMLSNNRYIIQSTGNGKYKITYTTSIEDIVTAGRGNQNNINSGNAWDILPTTSNPSIDNMRSLLNDLSQHDSAGYVKTLTNLAPTESQAALGTTREVANLIDRQIARRQQEQGQSSGDDFAKTGVWLQGLVNYSKQDNSFHSAGFTGKTAGFALGVDGDIDKDITLGFGYAFNHTKVDNVDRDIDVNGHTLFAYGKYQPSAWYVRSMVNYGAAYYKENALVASGLPNSADYDVQNFGVVVYYGYDLPSGFTPEVGLRYTHLTQDSYTDSVGQHINTEDTDILTGVIGVKYTKTFSNTKGISWTPKARFALTYDLITDDSTANVSIANINYEINGKSLARFGAEAGVGLEAYINNWEFSVGYDLSVRNAYYSHTGMLKAKYHF